MQIVNQSGEQMQHLQIGCIYGSELSALSSQPTGLLCLLSSAVACCGTSWISLTIPIGASLTSFAFPTSPLVICQRRTNSRLSNRSGDCTS